MIGTDTTPVWHTWEPTGQIIVDANIPVIAMGTGGLEFLGKLELEIGTRDRVQNTSDSVRPVKNAGFWKDFPVPATASGVHPVVAESSYAGVALPNPTDNVIPIGHDPDNENLYTLVAQKPHYFLWGYPGELDELTETGKALLAWSCRYTAAMNRKVSE
ncbi:MAG: hypothetical protein HKN47_03185 [Pirellulaceae bacterium]|nr:hypothetical protein [Pirellulaceae bacterium]